MRSVPAVRWPYPVVSNGGGSAQPHWMQTLPLDADPLGCRPPLMQTPAPVNRMTHRGENITLPQTSFVGGNKRVMHFLDVGKILRLALSTRVKARLHWALTHLELILMLEINQWPSKSIIAG